MEIEDAFTQEAIELYDTNVEGADEEKVRAMAQAVAKSNGVELSDDHESIGVLMFVAGRTYQEGKGLTVPMSKALASEFMEFLAQKGAT
jgi:hypothetical protein